MQSKHYKYNCQIPHFHFPLTLSIFTTRLHSTQIFIMNTVVYISLLFAAVSVTSAVPFFPAPGSAQSIFNHLNQPSRYSLFTNNVDASVMSHAGCPPTDIQPVCCDTGVTGHIVTINPCVCLALRGDVEYSFDHCAKEYASPSPSPSPYCVLIYSPVCCSLSTDLNSGTTVGNACECRAKHGNAIKAGPC